MKIAKKSVRNFAENVVLKLSSHSDSVAKNTRCGGDHINESGGAYGAMQTKGLSSQGDLSMPDSVSKYVQRWLTWVKSIYETKEDAIRNPLPRGV